MTPVSYRCNPGLWGGPIGSQTSWEKRCVSSAKAIKPASRAALAIAESFVTARRQGRALPAFPGVIPQTLDVAYACQEAAIEQWPDAIAGWKVGRVAAEFKTWVNESRLAGPIFAQAVWRVETDTEIGVPVFD